MQWLHGSSPAKRWAGKAVEPWQRDALVKLAREAGDAVMKLYRQHLESGIQVDTKSDDTPVTAADHKAHDILHAGLMTITPEVPQLSEEGEPIPWAQRQQWHEYWLIDPLDGTREFILGTDEFCICIAKIEQGFPTFGLIHAPVTGKTWLGGQGISCCIDEDDSEAPLAAGADLNQAAVVITSRGGAQRKDVAQWRDQLAANWPGGVEQQMLGSALKFCQLASGTAQAYPRFGAIGEWDVAAGQAILEAAGGVVVDGAGARLSYNQGESLILRQLFAVSSPDILNKVG
jgi:3'(2'), 5'-bisphosphate nucleotidase